MATLNLGRLKPVFRGSWNNATAYNIDDIVVRNNQSYISIQAGTNQDPATATAYWTLMAAKGSDGTDVGATLTTQGDVLYRDGSGLQRLAAGTAGQVLQTGGAGANPSWTAVSSDYVKLQTYTSLSGASGNYITFDFSSLFTSTYRDYKLRVDGMYNSSGSGHQLRGRLNVGGSLKSDSHYRVTGTYTDTYSGAASVSGHKRWDNDYFTLTWLEDSQPTNNTGMEITFYNPTNTTERPKFNAYTQGMDNNYMYQMNLFGMYNNSNDDIQGISFWGNGNTSIHFGNAILYGIK